MNIKYASLSDIDIITNIIVKANMPIAKTFSIDNLNGPSHPSNCKSSWIRENMDKGEIYFLIYDNNKAIGTIAYKIKGTVLTVKHLAVIPEFWGLGAGRILMDHIIFYAKSKLLSSINLGLLDDNIVLKEWYKGFGFSTVKSKKIRGLPYSVTFMKMIL